MSIAENSYQKLAGNYKTTYLYNGKGSLAFGILGRIHYGTPTWFKVTFNYAGSRTINYFRLEMKYPVITLGIDGSLSIIQDKEKLIKCSRISFKNGFYNNLIIIDNQHYKYITKNANVVGTSGIFWGLSLKYGQILKVNLNFSNEKILLSPSELALEIVATINRDYDYWAASDNINDVIESLKKTNNYNEVYSLINFLLYGE